MHTRQSLLNDLDRSGIVRSGTLMVHASMKAIGHVEGGADTVLDALCEYMQPGLLLLACHTWDKHNNPGGVFDPRKEPSCVGILGERLRQRPQACRSLHPTHSVVAVGQGAASYIANDAHASTPCPRDGSMGKLVDVGGQILFLGCPLTKNTFIHGVEEWNNIPKRLTAEPEAMTVKVDDALIPRKMHRHEAACGDISLNYDKLEPAFIELGAAHYCDIGDARSVVASASRMMEVTSRFLAINPDFLADKLPVPGIWYR